jgi:hypothetical protein
VEFLVRLVKRRANGLRRVKRLDPMGGCRLSETVRQSGGLGPFGFPTDVLPLGVLFPKISFYLVHSVFGHELNKIGK